MKNDLQTAPETVPDTLPDRLAHAKNYANELNESRLWKIKISYQKRWTACRRARKSAEIRYVRPWLRSTGPRTEAGKARSRRNAEKGGTALRPVIQAIAAQARFVRAVLLHLRLQKRGIPVSRTTTAALGAAGRAITQDLFTGLAVFLWFSECNRAQQ